MGQERVDGYAQGFKEGWDKALEVVDLAIDNFSFGDTEESIEARRSLKEDIRFGNCVKPVVEEKDGN